MKFPAKKHLLFPGRIVNSNLYAIAVNYQCCLQSLILRRFQLHLNEPWDYFPAKIFHRGVVGIIGFVKLF